MYIPPYRQTLEKAFQKEREEKKNRRGLEQAAGEHTPFLAPAIITDRQVGSVYTRYFARYLSTNELFEITSKQYEVALENKDYKFLVLEWDASFPITSELLSGYIKPGSNYRKYLTLLKYRVDYPEVFEIVIKDNTFSSVDYTPGKEFKDRQGKVFKGSYILDKSGEIFSVPDEFNNYERKKLYLIDKIFTEFDR